MREIGRVKRFLLLTKVQDEFEGLTYETLDENDRRKLNDYLIHATIIKQDEPSDDQSSIYHIFERLNTGGSQLKPQEIRACIFHGSLNELLYSLNKNEKWRLIYGKESNRMSDQELILRFFALYYDHDNYKKPMKNFLNEYMGSNRNLARNSKEELSELFNASIEIIYDNIERDSKSGERAFRLGGRGITASVFDAVIVGVGRRLSMGRIKDPSGIKDRYRVLLSMPDFIKACRTGTSDEKSVELRIKLATEAFSDVE